MRLKTSDHQQHHPFAPTTIEVYPTQRRRSMTQRAFIVVMALAVAAVSFIVGWGLPIWLLRWLP